MIEALIAGERGPRVLADLARGKMKAKRAALIEALTGRFDEHHAELARMLLDQIDQLNAQIAKLTDRIGELIGVMPAARGVDADGSTGPSAGAGPDAAVVPALQRLDEIPGIGPGGAQVILAEIGLDMSRFPTAGHLVSWASCRPAPSSPGPHPRRADRQGQPLSQGHPRRGRRRGRQDRHLPRRALPAPGQAHRQAQGPGRRRPVHPGDHLEPARRPPSPLPRPRRRLLRQPHRHRPQGPHHIRQLEPSGSPYPRPRRLTSSPLPPRGPRAGSAGAAARPLRSLFPVRSAAAQSADRIAPLGQDTAIFHDLGTAASLSSALGLPVKLGTQSV